MKKIFLVLILFISITIFISCDSPKKEITCEDVISIYQEFGYEVFHKQNDEDSDEICYVKCTAPDSEDYIMFYFFDSKEEAENYADEREWNGILFFYSCAMFEPTWLKTKTYNNIEIEYSNNYTYKPFKSLLK